MLTKCPECELPVSDKALACPHCGYPIKDSIKKRARKKPNKRRRLPNGFGQISELKGQNLRKPFRAMVTIGKTNEGKPICKLLQPEAYFETYNEAYQALMEYNKNPHFMTNSITIGELYDRWYKRDIETASHAVISLTKTAWRYCQSVINIKVIELRPYHIRYCMEEATVVVDGVTKTASSQVKSRIKTIFNKMLDYAVEFEIVDKNYSRMFAPTKTKQEDTENINAHIPYIDEEIQKLWENIGDPIVDALLVQCYSGMRPTEVCIIETSNVNINDRIIIGGIKTKAGKNRHIPIHHRILPIIEKHYNDANTAGSKYLFFFELGGKLRSFNYPWYRLHFKNIIKELNLNQNHKAHDGRMHFITQAKKYQIDEYALKRIVGHTISDITESVYTKRNDEWLVQEIEKIKE